MKKQIYYLSIFSLISFLAFGFVISRFSSHTMSSLLKQLEITDSDAKEYVWSNCLYLSFNFPSPKELKDAAKGERPAIVKLVGEYAKNFTKSNEFLSRYKEYMESARPQAPEAPESTDDIMKRQKSEMSKSIRDMEEAAKNMPAAQRSEMQKLIKALKEQMVEMQSQTSALNTSETADLMKQGHEAQMAEYKEKLAQWEKEYKSGPSQLVKKWLERFLEESSNINYNAELRQNESGKKIFVNPEYEAKSDLWKLCFRAGKETVEAARTFAAAWLKEID
ncbi:MAG: hypothetical protein ACM3S2_07490 [Ignavibacteriales bacterium]